MRLERSSMRRAGWAIGLGVLALLLLFGNQLAGLIVTWLWFGEVGQRRVFLTILAARAQLALLFGVSFFLLTFLNVWLARRATPELTPRYDDFPIRVQVGRLARTGLTLILLIGSLIAGLLAGLEASGHWDDYLRFLHPVPFGRTDPIFGRDLGFYVFQYPFLSYLLDWIFLALLLVIVATLLVYYFDRAVEMLQGYAHVAAPVRVHISVLLGLVALVKAWGYRLEAYGLLFSPNGAFFGAGYTDQHARLLSLNLLTVLAIVAAIGFLANAFLRLLWLPGVSLALMIVASILLGGVYPGIVQRFTVQPNELALERPYIQRHLALTRAAYGLDQVVVSPFGQTAPLSQANVQRNQATIQNVRLWDYRSLQETYRQLQQLKPYYDFPDVDIDRYPVGGQSRQVMLAARELSQAELQLQAPGWVNQWLAYTHGYGFVMNPVNQATPDGAPIFWAGDAPQRTPRSLPVTRPQIYFGDADSPPVVAPSRTAEFDYPIESETVRGRYSGSGGVPLGGSLRRLLFATYFGETNLLISTAITPDSRILFNRRIDERAARIAPFLRFDADPYLVVADGRLLWIQDAYTVSSDYPYSLPAQQASRDPAINPARNLRDWDMDSLQPDDGDFNYIRNSVKIVTDAYNGTVRFYVADAADPVIQCYQSAFPTLFQPMSAMSPALRAHIRYPEGLFTIQASLFASYHVTDPTVLFQQADLWEFPKETVTHDVQQMTETGVVGTVTRTESLPIEPFYVTMRLPDGQAEEFVLMLPFQFKAPPNMSAWLCARCDGAEYGHLRAYLFPTGTNGPTQAESYIEQNPEISSHLSLWSQHGSKVIRGHLLTIPLDQSILYVRPIYVVAEANGVPRLSRVILESDTRAVMAPTLNEALSALVRGESGDVNPAPGTEPVPAPPAAAPSGPGTPAAPPPTPAATGSVSALVNQANQAYEKATDAQRRGDWATYGAELKRLQQTLRQLQQRTGLGSATGPKR